jgi:hypothetical protein
MSHKNEIWLQNTPKSDSDNSPWKNITCTSIGDHVNALDVVQHAHANSVNLHFESGDLTASQDFIIIDISDTANYAHDKTGFAHLESVTIDTDATSNAAYTLELGFLANVDATNGDFYTVHKLVATKTAGQIKSFQLIDYPNGAQFNLDKFTTASKSLNDTSFQTDTNLATTLDPTTADTPSGNGDVVLRVTVTAGTVSVILGMSYHAHA